MRKKNALLIIDAQYDFCNPNGALYVKGAEEDNKRLAQWIVDNSEEIDYIAATLDSHVLNDIAHPSYWMDANGNYPAPFTLISSQDVKDGKWTPRFAPHEALAYLESLEAQNEYKHCIWPPHCRIGSKGHSLDDIIDQALSKYQESGKMVKFVTKGTHPQTEHFGAFRAQVPVPGASETDINMKLINTLETFQNVYLTGQAKSHCVANTLKQALEISPSLAKKFVVLEDTMSPVPGFENLADSIYDKARQMGVRFSTTAKEKLAQHSGVATVA
jgi:nicotinamidase-related amidase